MSSPRSWTTGNMSRNESLHTNRTFTSDDDHETLSLQQIDEDQRLRKVVNPNQTVKQSGSDLVDEHKSIASDALTPPSTKRHDDSVILNLKKHILALEKQLNSEKEEHRQTRERMNKMKRRPSISESSEPDDDVEFGFESIRAPLLEKPRRPPRRVRDVED